MCHCQRGRRVHNLALFVRMVSDVPLLIAGVYALHDLSRLLLLTRPAHLSAAIHYGIVQTTITSSAY